MYYPMIFALLRVDCGGCAMLGDSLFHVEWFWVWGIGSWAQKATLSETPRDCGGVPELCCGEVTGET
jgi:hypothetical protein